MKILLEKLVEGVTADSPALTRRDVRLPRIPNKAMAVIGMRRSGKSTFLWQCLSDRIAAGAPRAAQVYINFEDDRLGPLGTPDLDRLLESYFERYPEFRGSRRIGLFLDEVQLVSGWDRFVRRVMDSEKVDIFLSGSSAKLLSREVATALRGRALEVLVHPFSFREALAHTGDLPKEGWSGLTGRGRSRVRAGFERYLESGGFPEAQGLSVEDRGALLRSYTDVAVLRDVIDRHQVTNPTALRWMQRHLLGNAAAKFSIEKFHAALHSQGLAVGKNTLHDYLGHLEDAFLIRVVSLDTGSERQRMVNPRKAYPIDPALIPLFDRTGRENRGHRLETVVALELERRGASISYVKTPAGFEVDFLARFPNGKTALIQVCAKAADPDVFQREVRSLEDAKDVYPHAERWLLVGENATSLESPTGVVIQSVLEWLMGDE
ncbi:MAG: ATP-binding protein [Kiritimatiellia bacterium]|nr:ATP-binding protein [Kiritimatiellia bacterium]